MGCRAIVPAEEITRRDSQLERVISMVILGFHVEEEGEKVHMMGAPDSSNGHACCLKLRHLIYKDGDALSKRLMQFYVTLATTVLLEVWALSLDERRHLRYVCSGGSDVRPEVGEQAQGQFRSCFSSEER